MTPTQTDQRPQECEHYCDEVCAVHNKTMCLNTLFSVRYGYQKPNCPDYEPKEKKNDARVDNC